MPLRQDGPVTTGTCLNLVEGVRAAPLPQEAVNAVMDQITRFSERLVEIYSDEVAPNEVGHGGSGVASEEPIIGERPPRILLYGRVQSGKTVSMILTSALCLDNGFRVVVVLTTDNVALVKQTADRFKDLEGPRVFAAVKEGSSYPWEGQEDELRSEVATDGIVFVCAKNWINLPEVIRFLQQLDASTYPVLIFDDEADAATPDTTIAARSADRPNAPPHASLMHRLVIENDRPGEAGFSLGEELPHALYIQVTATPYVLFLQRESAQLRPTETFLLEPGEGYCGGEVFFGDFDPALPAAEQPPTIVLVGDNEGATMRRQAPQGFARSIDYFILAACARSIEHGWPTNGFNHLSHTSHKTDEHAIVSGYIDGHLNELRRLFRGPDQLVIERFEEAYAELKRTLGDHCRPIAQLIGVAKSAMRHAEVIRINYKTDSPAFGPRLNFIIGGNILGRGLTIDNLLVTYYVREARTSQMDTVWQHARMYGYRRPYLDFMRIYLPRRLADRFKQIHEAEEALRQTLGADENAAAVLIRVPGASRPTRPNAIEAGAVRALQAGRNQIFPHFLKIDTEAALAVRGILQANNVPVGLEARDQRPTQIPLEAAKALIEATAVNEDDPGLWQPETILALLASFADRMRDRCVVYVREVEDRPPPEGWWRGRLGGPEIALMRQSSPDAPSLALLYSGAADQPQAWYPTLVMPAGSPTFVFSGQ
jgi:hypothetical protein